MKKIILTVTFVFAGQFLMAQTNEAFKQDVLKVIEISGSASQLTLAKDQILKLIPKEKQTAFLAEFNASLPSLYDKIAEIYMSEYTHEDVKQILKFYDTPVGKKMTQKSAVIAEKSMAAGQQWGASLQSMMTKYMQ